MEKIRRNVHYPERQYQQLVTLKLTDYESGCIQIALESYLKTRADENPEPAHPNSCVGTVNTIREALYRASTGSHHGGGLGNVSWDMVSTTSLNAQK